MSPDSISSSAGDSSAKSLPASRSVALAITRRTVSVSSSGPRFLILVLALGHHLLGLRQLGLLGRAFLGGVHTGGTGRLGQDVARRRAGRLRGLGGLLAAQLGHRLTQRRRTSRRTPGRSASTCAWLEIRVASAHR